MTVFSRLYDEGLKKSYRQLLRLLPLVCLRQLSQRVAKRRPIAPWPSWEFAAIENSNIKSLAILRNEIVSHAVQNQRRLMIDYVFQPGIKLRIGVTEMLGKCLFLSGCCEPNEFAYLDRALKNGMTFLDVGANIGLFTVWAAHRVKQDGLVVALEPSQREFTRLEENIRLNKLNNVQLLNIGASDTCRTGRLHISDQENHGLNTLGSFIHPDVREVESATVALERIDDIVQRLKIKHIDIAKIDAEGHELFILQGMCQVLDRDHPALLIEVEEATLKQQGCTTTELFDFLNAFGYKTMAFGRSTGLLESINKGDSWHGNNLVWIAK